MAKLIRLDKGNGRYALARKGGKLVTDAGGAPCCCGGTPPIGCGIPSPICASFDTPESTCGQAFDLGGRYRVEMSVDEYDVQWSEILFRHEIQGSFPFQTHLYSRSDERGAISLDNPGTQSVTVAYCQSTQNWIMCWDNSSPPNAITVSAINERASCSAGANPNYCTPVFDPSNPEYERTLGTGNALPRPNLRAGFWTTLATSCYDSNSSTRARNFGDTFGNNVTLPSFLGELNPVSWAWVPYHAGVQDEYFTDCGTHPYTVNDGTGLHSVNIVAVSNVLPPQFDSLPTNSGEVSVSGSLTVTETRTASSLTRRFITDYSYHVDIDTSLPGSNTGELTGTQDRTAKIDMTVKWTKLDPCTGGASAPLPPHLDEYGRPRKQPGQCAGCGD